MTVRGNRQQGHPPLICVQATRPLQEGTMETPKFNGLAPIAHKSCAVCCVWLLNVMR